jgi:hypothetical protein
MLESSRRSTRTSRLSGLVVKQPWLKAPPPRNARNWWRSPLHSYRDGHRRSMHLVGESTDGCGRGRHDDDRGVPAFRAAAQASEHFKAVGPWQVHGQSGPASSPGKTPSTFFPKRLANRDTRLERFFEKQDTLFEGSLSAAVPRQSEGTVEKPFLLLLACCARTDARR